MKDTETVTLDKIAQIHHDLWESAQGREPRITKHKATMAIIKLFEQAVESAKPNHERVGTNPNTEERKMKAMWNRGHNRGIDQYEQNLLQALSNSGKQQAFSNGGGDE